MDAGTREIIGAHVGSRGHESAQALWASLPAVYRQCAVIYTDAWGGVSGRAALEATSGRVQRQRQNQLH